MRRTLFCLLILLTAFRGMVGDVMAYGMTQQALQDANATELVAPHADSATADGHFSFLKPASMPCHEVPSDAATDTPTHACNSCMVCHSPMLERKAVLTGLTKQMTAYTLSQERDWANADLIRLQKPPVF